MRYWIPLILLLPVWSQENRGTIVGRIADPSDSVVAGAAITVKNLETNVEVRSVSNESGNYLVPSLPPGRYQVAVESAGFKRAETKEVVLQIQQQARLDFRLELGNVTETVSVQSQAPLLMTEDAALGQVVDNKKIVELPISRRNLSSLTLLGPGTSISRAGTDRTLSGILTAGVAMSANGMRTSTNTYSVDGASTNVAIYNYPSFIPVVDAVQEFKVRTGNYSAEFGGFGGAHIDFSLKSGTNQIHGTVWEFLRNDRFDARNAFSTSQKPVLRQNQFGGMISGPVVRNRTFYMGTYQGFRRRSQQILQGTVPTAEQRQGDLSRTVDGRAEAAIRDPLSGSPFPANRIPAARFSDTMQRALAFYPAANQAGGVNFRRLVAVPRDEDMVLGKVDHIFSDRNRLSVRYVYEVTEEVGTLPLIADFGSTVPTRAQNAVISDTHTFSPTTFMDVRISWNRMFLKQLTPRNTSDNNFDARQALNMVIPSSARPGAIENGFPFIATTGYSSLGDRVGGSPLLQPDDNYQIAGNATALRGSHKLKFGVDFRRTRSVRFRSQDNNGTLNFLPGNAAGSGHPFTDFLLGLPFSSVINLTPMTVDLLQQQSHFFVADDWAVSKRLVVNLGLRYEYNTPANEPYGRIPFINLTAPGTVEVLKPGAPLFVKDFNNFAPRIGVAYRPAERTVVRAGYGVFYSESSWLHLTNHVLNPPFFVRQNFFASRELALQARDPFPLGQAAAGGLPAPVAYQRDRRTAYVQTWSINVQRSFGGNLVAEAGYVGNHAVKMPRNVQLNIPLPGPGNIQARRPLPNFGPVNTYIQNDATTNYNGLQTRIEKRFSGGLSLLGAYTFMRAIDLSGNEQEGSTIDPRNLNRDRGLSDNFVKHRLSVSYVFELPFGRGRRWLAQGGIVDQALGGWQLSGVTVLQSGPAFTVSAPGDRANIGLGTRPNRICDGNLASGRAADRWFDGNCFVLPDQFTVGNSGRNVLIGPPLQTWDIGIMKRFAITENHYLQFRAEMFNALNNVNLGVPGASLGTPSFGRVIAAESARSIQFGLKYGF